MLGAVNEAVGARGRRALALLLATLATLALTAPARAAAQTFACQARLDGVRLAEAAEQFHTLRGRWPDGADELVAEGFLRRVPIGPDRKPMTIRPGPDGALVVELAGGRPLPTPLDCSLSGWFPETIASAVSLVASLAAALVALRAPRGRPRAAAAAAALALLVVGTLLSIFGRIA